MKIYKKNSFPRIINYEYNVIKKNHLHQIDDLFKANEEKNITIKNYWEEDLLSQKPYCSSNKKFFYNFVRNEYRK
jgi:hypothetical protein